MGLKTISGDWDLQGRIRCETAKPGEEPVVGAAVGDRVRVIGVEVAITVAKIETRKAAEGRSAYVWYTPVEGSIKRLDNAITPDSSEEAMEQAGRLDAGATGELPGA